ncbi:transcription termination/antitermination protein NusG [Aceticella autotrophica]|uniref:Transcription termination/antitermination protein NusG n=1 Tax=Aceticella autotrophica TaxID=2755338 RepID=A0A975AXT8_9THEO|nr:transcription termination/antitermination protein NusG [Aceticella autotrophica]QSZ28439.1 transcription termination/antitermination protein NusG [Aceticella autotrophica]
MAENNMTKWYVVHTYSGYENKVKANLEKAVENRGLQDLIQQIVVPTDKIVEIKDGKKKTVDKKVFPGYVLVKMVMTNDSWYIVRNTRGVTGFVGPESKEPVPLTEKEVKALGIREELPSVDISPGDSVRIVTGPLENFIGVVQEIYLERQKAKVLISMFGRETPVEFDLVQIQKIQ